jgi:hypothetical protein
VRLIRETFPEDADTAVAVGICESNLRMVRSNHILNYGREESYGVMQVHARAWHDTALSLGLSDYQTDVRQNLAMARHIYEQAGHSWNDWTCYTKRMHLAHL